ncbi:cupin domain-containing protein [Paenibacillus sp. NEAU-GSW1]|nr:cupin domain-containing protein [Paenibacillus sp. NEAU-GSW1]
MHANTRPQALLNAAYPYYYWQPYPHFYLHPYVQYAFPPVYPTYVVNEQRFTNWQARELKDHGKEPYVIDIEQAAEQNSTYRTALWTGEHFQVTVMSIPVGADIGLEVHPDTDQFIRIEEGQGFVQMGDAKDRLDFEAAARDGYAIMVPAGKWHNVTNTGNEPLKVYVIYAPPEHPFGTVHPTKADAMAEEA